MSDKKRPTSDLKMGLKSDEARASNSQGSIQLASNLKDFFAQELHSIANKQGLSISVQASSYLASVLTKFGDAQNLLVRESSQASNAEAPNKSSFPTLALMFLESQQIPTNEQFFKLLHVGDVALFTSGFFGDRILKKSLDMDYYMAMGGMAYERAGHIRETLANEKALNIYFEISASFKNLVEVFSELSDQSLLTNDKDVLKLYEKWLENGNHRIARMLGEIGVIAAQNETKHHPA
jgi:hypothetical protein